MTRPLQVRAQKGDLVETDLGEKPELEGQKGENRRDVHETGVVGYEDVTRAGVQLFQPFGADMDKADGQHHPRPDPRYGVLRPAGTVEEGGRDR